MGRAYASAYYTHSEPGAVESWPASRGAAVRERLLKGYINSRFGYRFKPAMEAGRAVVPALPGARGMASSYVRHLPAPTEGARVLDVGCGNGEFLLRMRAAGWEVQGLEVDPASRAWAESSGIPVHPGQLTADTFPAASFEAITMNHVIEHLHHPRELLVTCYLLLKPGGILWIAAPNGGAAGLERFGRDWAPLDPPRHTVHFTYDALRRALVEAGFDEVFTTSPTLLATRWTYRMSNSFAVGRVRVLAPIKSAVRDVARSVVADVRTLVQPEGGEELVIVGRKSTTPA